jgi:hypothetical protein
MFIVSTCFVTWAEALNRLVEEKLLRRGSTKETALDEPVQVPEENPSDQIPDANLDRRRWQRRTVNTVPIMLADKEDGDWTAKASVLNRSRGGLLLRTAQPVAEESTLWASPAEADVAFPRVAIIVRRCEPESEHWLLGCDFRDELPWEVLLRFG